MTAAGQFKVDRFCSESRLTSGPFEEQNRSRRCVAQLVFDQSNALLVRGALGTPKRLRLNDQSEGSFVLLEVPSEANLAFAESRRSEVNGPNYFLSTDGRLETGPSSVPVSPMRAYTTYPPPASERRWFGPIAAREDGATVWLRPTFNDYDADGSDWEARLINLINEGRTPYVPEAHDIGLFAGSKPSVLGSLSLPRDRSGGWVTFSRDGNEVFGDLGDGKCWRWDLTGNAAETLACSSDSASVACKECAAEGWQIVQIRDAQNDLRVIREVNARSGTERARLWSRTRRETLASLIIASTRGPAAIDFDTDVEISDDGELLAVAANSGDVFVFETRELMSRGRDHSPSLSSVGHAQMSAFD